jgi:hypothetical protein
LTYKAAILDLLGKSHQVEKFSEGPKAAGLRDLVAESARDKLICRQLKLIRKEHKHIAPWVFSIRFRRENCG